MSQEADCKTMVDTALDKFGALHVAFNNAGVFRTGSFAEITDEVVNPIMDTNIKALAWCFKYQVWVPDGSLLQIRTHSYWAEYRSWASGKAAGVP